MSTLRTNSTRLSITSLAVAVILAGTAPIFASAGKPGPQHGQGHHGGDHVGAETAIGKPGKVSDAKRTINVTMQDNFFEPEEITVAAGETVRFKVVNKGTLLHEFGLGTSVMHAAHQKAMAVMMKQGIITADRINTKRMTHVMPDGTVMQGAKHASHGPAGQAGATHVMPDGTAMQGAKHASHGPKGQAGATHVMPDGTAMQGAKHASHGQEHMSHGPKGQADATHVMPDGTVMTGAKHVGYGGMGHDPGQGDMSHMHGPESGSVLVEPGKSAEIIWTFSKRMKLEFACNVPGHYEAGMVGPLTVQ